MISQYASYSASVDYDTIWTLIWETFHAQRLKFVDHSGAISVETRTRLVIDKGDNQPFNSQDLIVNSPL